MIAHQKTRTMMLSRHSIDMITAVYEQPPSVTNSLPTITVNRSMQLYFNNQRIDLLPVEPAHTVGDIVVIFRGQNVVHTGDLYDPQFPYIDVDNRGSINGMIRFLEVILAKTNTIVVPEHGEVGTYQDLKDHLNVLKSIRGRIQVQIDQGKTLEQVIASYPTSGFKAFYEDVSGIIEPAYKSLLRD